MSGLGRESRDEDRTPLDRRAPRESGAHAIPSYRAGGVTRRSPALVLRALHSEPPMHPISHIPAPSHPLPSRAFTLIELLITMLVISLIMTVFLLPGIGRTHCGGRQLKDSTQV